MSLLASDFEESFASTQMGSICDKAYFEWIAYIIEHCPVEFHAAMADDIIRAFFIQMQIYLLTCLVRPLPTPYTTKAIC